jgi:hypothetical protein
VSIGRETAGTTTLGRQGLAQGGFVPRGEPAEPSIVEAGGGSGDEEAGQGSQAGCSCCYIVGSW